MRRSPLIVLPTLLLLLVATACGGAAASGDADPASAVPAGTAIYFEGVVRPEGDQREDVLDAAGKLMRTDDPERELRELIDRALRESDENITYEKDIAPWLGEKAAVWVSGVEREAPGYVVLVAAEDTDKAQEAIDRGVKEGGEKVTQRSFEGVDYQVAEDGVAAGVVEDWFTVGTEAEFKRTISAAKGDSLAEAEKYERAVDALEEDRLGQFYLDLKPLFEQALKSNPDTAGDFQQFRSLFPVDELDPFVGALLADGNRIALDTITRGKGVDAIKALGPLAWTGSTPLVGELPGDAWLAAGSPDVGPGLKTLFNRAAGAFGGAAATQQLEQRYGIDLERDVFGWIGDIALFARDGEGADVDGGLVIEATDPAAMRGAFGKIVGLLQQEGGQKVTPVRIEGADAAFAADGGDSEPPLVLARSEDRVVAAYGEPAAAAALAPGEKLADSDLYAQAEEALEEGGEPAFVLSMPAVLRAVERMGSPDADYAKAKPYLEAVSLLAANGSASEEEIRSRFVAGLK